MKHIFTIGMFLLFLGTVLIALRVVPVHAGTVHMLNGYGMWTERPTMYEGVSAYYSDAPSEDCRHRKIIDGKYCFLLFHFFDHGDEALGTVDSVEYSTELFGYSSVTGQPLTRDVLNAEIALRHSQLLGSVITKLFALPNETSAPIRCSVAPAPGASFRLPHGSSVVHFGNRPGHNNGLVRKSPPHMAVANILIESLRGPAYPPVTVVLIQPIGALVERGDGPGFVRISVTDHHNRTATADFWIE
jgi:hypothetical protein